MEAFSLLKYWKTSAGGGGGGGIGGAAAFPLPGGGATGTTTTIVTAVGDHAVDSDDSDAGDDDGPFFDLEFAVPADEEEEDGEEKRENGVIDEGEEEEEEEENDDVGGGGGEREVKFRLSSSTSSCDRSSDPNLSLSPSDDLFYNGRIVRIDGSEEEIGSKSGQFPIPVSLLRSATKFRVFMLGLKRSKSESTTTTAKSQPQPQKENQNQNQPQNQQQSNKNNNKFFTVKFKVEEVPIISLLTRASSNSKPNNNTATVEEQPANSTSDSCDEKRNKMETMQKYLKLVKPLYVRVSKRHQATTVTTAEEQVAPPEAAVEVVEAGETRRETKGMKLKGIIAKKHLGKSKSAVVHSMPPNVASNRRDDSLLQQQDGIQSAILHCKRSFNASREMEAASSVLSRSASDPSHEKKTTTVTTMALELRREQERDDVV